MGRILGVGFLIVLAVAAFVGVNSIFVVSETQQALVIRVGEPVRTENQYGVDEPGLKFKVPFLENVVTLDKRNLLLDAQPDEITAVDQQRVSVDAFVRWRIRDPLQFYTRLNNEERARQRLAQLLNTNLREVLGTVTTTDIISGQRAELMQRIQTSLTRAVDQASLGIEIIDVKIRRVELPSQNRQRVFERMIAERNQEAQLFRAEGREEATRIRADADRQVRVIQATANEESQRIRGEGDGERNRIYAEAYNQDPEFFAFYRSMLAYETAMGQGTTMLLSPDSDFFSYFGDQDGDGRR